MTTGSDGHDDYIMESEELFVATKRHAEEIYKKTGSLSCPFFVEEKVVLNSDGFHHLEYKPNRMLRNQSVASLKFRLLPWAFNVIKKSGTLQEYRSGFIPIGREASDGSRIMKRAEYFGFSAIVGEGYKTRIKVIVRRIGNGAVHFWSVMPAVKAGKDGNRTILMNPGIEDE